MNKKTLSGIILLCFLVRVLSTSKAFAASTASPFSSNVTLHPNKIAIVGTCSLSLPANVYDSRGRFVGSLPSGTDVDLGPDSQVPGYTVIYGYGSGRNQFRFKEAVYLQKPARYFLVCKSPVLEPSDVPGQ